MTTLRMLCPTRIHGGQWTNSLRRRETAESNNRLIDSAVCDPLVHESGVGVWTGSGQMAPQSFSSVPFGP